MILFSFFILLESWKHIPCDVSFLNSQSHDICFNSLSYFGTKDWIFLQVIYIFHSVSSAYCYKLYKAGPALCLDPWTIYKHLDLANESSILALLLSGDKTFVNGRCFDGKFSRNTIQVFFIWISSSTVTTTETRAEKRHKNNFLSSFDISPCCIYDIYTILTMLICSCL